tara:strand:+ start:1190 stop:1609 length:420 start_codon:yes stop_codon:yes gene_type:complete
MTVPTQTALERRFYDFHRRNPRVYLKLRTLSIRLKKTGATSYGMKALFEIMRFNALLQSDTKFKLSNSYAPYYARLLMINEPELYGFFEVRELVSKTKQQRDTKLKEAYEQACADCRMLSSRLAASVDAYRKLQMEVTR